MGLTLTKKNVVLSEKDQSPMRWSNLRAWVCSWELYVLLVLASFLRLYEIRFTEFDGDQADIFAMARDAIVHARLVATSNISSLHTYNPPATIYLLMLPASISANPLWGSVFTALLAILAVLLTYGFVRYYYGRLAGAIAALTYATAAVPVFYSRFMWNQNFLLFFVPLYIAVLFWGVVARHKGWLAPAIILLGWLLQLHPSSILLVVPLVAALFLSPKTIRWRDFFYAAMGLLVIYSSYIVWLFYSQFSDFAFLFANRSKVPASAVDDQSWLLYQYFVSPYHAPFTNKASLLYPYVSFFAWLSPTMVTLAVGGALLALVGICWSRRQSAGTEAVSRHLILRMGGHVRSWWRTLRATPARCGLIVLLLWQVFPVVGFINHSLTLYPHYFIILLPGPFILVGLCIAKVVAWLRQRHGWEKALRFGFYGLAFLLVFTQFTWTTLTLLDSKFDRVSDRVPYNPTYVDDLNSMQHALSLADQLAQQRHLNHVYVSADTTTISAFTYLAGQMRTPTTVESSACFAVPAAAYGPAVLLVSPYSPTVNALVNNFVHATWVASPPHLGGAPFRLYILQPLPVPNTPAQNLSQQLQFFGKQAFNLPNGPSFITRWRFSRSTQPAYRTTYAYTMQRISAVGVVPSLRADKCTFTATRAGDQILATFVARGPFSVQITASVSTPTVISLHLVGPLALNFDTYYLHTSNQVLQTAEGQKRIIMVPQVLQTAGGRKRTSSVSSS